MALKHVVEILESEAYEGSTVLVLVAIGQHCDSDTHECFPGLERIRREARLSDKRTVRRILRQLEEAGVVHTTPGGGPRGVNLYRLDLPRLWVIGATQREARERKKAACRGGHIVPPGGIAESAPDLDEGEDILSPRGTKLSPPLKAAGGGMGGTQLSPPGGDIAESPKPSINNQNKTRAREAEIFARLKAELGEVTFGAWFRDAELHEPDDPLARAVMVAGSAFMANYIRQHFGDRLERLLGRRIEIVAHGVRRSKAAQAERAAT